MVYKETIQTEAERIEHLKREVLVYDDPEYPERLNFHFESKPTEEELDEWIIRHWILPQKRKKKKFKELEQKMIKEIDATLIDSRLITISIDQKIKNEELKEVIFKIVETIKKSNYSWMVNAHGTAEFFTESGWNPHFHLYCENELQPSVIAQTIRRKLLKHLGDKIYRVNGKRGTAKNQENYCLENKVISKQNYQIKDEAFRDKWDIPEKFIF